MGSTTGIFAELSSFGALEIDEQIGGVEFIAPPPPPRPRALTTSGVSFFEYAGMDYALYTFKRITRFFFFKIIRYFHHWFVETYYQRGWKKNPLTRAWISWVSG